MKIPIKLCIILDNYIDNLYPYKKIEYITLFRDFNNYELLLLIIIREFIETINNLVF